MKASLYLFLLLCARPIFAEDRPIKIGFITDLTGHGAFYGKQSQAGALLLQDELRAGGKRVEIVFGDTGFSAKQAVSEAQKMIYADKVDAFFVEFTPHVFAVAPIARAAQKPMMAVCGSTSFLKENPQSFKTFLDYKVGCGKIARYWKARGLSKIGVAKISSEPGERCMEGVYEVFPEAIEAVYNPKDEMSQVVLKLKSAGAEAVISSGYEGDAENLIKAMRNQRLRIPLGGPGPDLITDKIIKQYRADLEDSVAFGYAPLPAAFSAALKAHSGLQAPLEEAAANSYLFIKQLISAIESCPRGDVACQAQRIEANRSDPLLQFTGWRDRIAAHDFKLTTWKGGKRVEISG